MTTLSHQICATCNTLDVYCRCDPAMDAFYEKADAAKNEENEYCRALLYHSSMMEDIMHCESHTDLVEAYKAYQLKMGLSFGRHVYCMQKITCDFCMQCDTCMLECKEAIRHYEWPMAVAHWEENYAATYVPFNPLVGQNDTDVYYLTWKHWTEYKQYNGIQYDFTKKL